MATATKNVVRKKRGRPATGQDPVSAIRLSAELRASVDAWAARQDDKPGRSEAIRRLVEIGIRVKDHGLTNDRQHSRARDMATTTIDGKLDPAAPEGERVRRKGRLIKGPEEFQETRVDRPKRK